MNRNAFMKRLALLGLCPVVIGKLTAQVPETNGVNYDDDIKQLKAQKEFIENWLSDLLDSLEQNVDRKMQEKIVGFCGKKCYSRYSFKQDIAQAGKGNLENLIKAYSKNFEIWKEENKVHIRYGEVSKQCYCPAANYRTAKPMDIHCECTRNTHKAVFEAALDRTFDVQIVETLRRGGKTCHFVVDVS